MRPVLERFVTQIQRSFEYCEHQFGCATVKKIILAGGGAKLKGLKEYLSKEMGIEVTDALPEIAEAVGLAIVSSNELNMLPAKFKEEKGSALKNISLRMISIVAGFIFLLSYGFLSVKAVNLTKELQIYKAHLETVEDIRVIRDKMIVLGGAVNTISSSSIKTGKIMKELSNIVLSSMVLGNVVIRDKEPNIELSGVVVKGEELSEFMSSLEKSSMFEKVKLIFSERNQDYSKGALDFEITANLTRQ